MIARRVTEIEPSTGGLKVVHPTLSRSERHRGAPRNALISCVSIAVTHALLCVLMSAPESVTALNLHEMTNGFPCALGLFAQCNFVHRAQACS